MSSLIFTLEIEYVHTLVWLVETANVSHVVHTYRWDSCENNADLSLKCTLIIRSCHNGVPPKWEMNISMAHIRLGTCSLVFFDHITISISMLYSSRDVHAACPFHNADFRFVHSMMLSIITRQDRRLQKRLSLSIQGRYC